jgi:hypothetical protein
MTGNLLAVLLFPMLGLALSRICGRMQPFLAGAGISGAFAFVCGVAGVPVPVSAAFLILGAGVVLLRTRGARQSRIGYPAAPTVLLAALASWLLAFTAVVPLDDYDGRAFWLLKAKAIAHEQAIDGPFFRQETTSSPRNQYPLLVPIDAALLMTAGGELDERQTRWLYAGFAIAFALEIRRRFAERFTASIGAWLAAFFLALPVILSPRIGAASAGCDIALGAFAACAFFELMEGSSPFRFGLWLAFAALTKSEGLPLAALLLVIGAFVYRRRLVVALAPFTVAGGSLLLWRRVVERSDENPFASMVFELPAHAGRFALFIGDLLQQLVSFHLWGGLGLAFAGSLLLLVRRQNWKVAGSVVSVLVPMVLLYAAVVAVTDWEADVMIDLAPRLVTHLLGPAFYAIAAAWPMSTAAANRSAP